MTRSTLRAAVPLATLALVPLVPALTPVAQAATPSLRAAAVSTDTTSALEARRVDRVQVNAAAWSPCPLPRTDRSNTGEGSGSPLVECATVTVPLDYDVPDGPTVDIALLRQRARDPEHRIGSLLVNPGGPGGSGTAVVRRAHEWMGRDLLDRFDVVGFDPRGIGDSTQVRCFRSGAERDAVMRTVDFPFPHTQEQQRAYIRMSEVVGTACSTVGRPLAASMSTAQVARDLDILRRAVGDDKLSFLGFSYGSFLGQVYANLFPDRFRALTIDGVLDPLGWVGSPRTADVPLAERINAPAGTLAAFHELLDRCEQAGPGRCPLAKGNARADAELVLKRIAKHPVTITLPSGEEVVVTYDLLVSTAIDDLYDPNALEPLTDLLFELLSLTDPDRARSEATAKGHRLAAGQALARIRTELSKRSLTGQDDEAYDSSDGGQVVLCTDGRHGRSPADWSQAAARVEKKHPYFGTAWSWMSAPCARDVWTAQDEDAYTGPFTRRTAAPVLVVGNTWDPATNHRNAITVSHLLPNSRLLDSDNWGHCAYGTSACASDAIDQYLITGTPPAPGTTCHGDLQPYEGTRPPTTDTSSARGAVRLPPVTPGTPGESLS